MRIDQKYHKVERQKKKRQKKKRQRKGMGTNAMSYESGEPKENKKKEMTTDARSNGSGESRVASSLTESQPPVRRSAR